MDKKGNPSPTQLSVRVTQNSMSVVASGAVERAKLSAQNIAPQSPAAAILSDQQILVTSSHTLMDKLKVLVKVGDEVTRVCTSASSPFLNNLNFSKKIHPYVNFAWQVLSGGMKVSRVQLCMSFLLKYLFDQMVLAQQARDIKILDLVRAMESTYSLVVSADHDELKSSPVLQDIIEKILMQTIECGYFIREYMQHSFGGSVAGFLYHNGSMTKDHPESVITHPFDNVDEKIAAFCTVFTELRKDFDSKLSLRTALVLFRIASSVDTISAYA
jgi:hypothetical protein